MTPEERQLIGDLFDRMRSTGLQDKDREAESFINQFMRSTPDAAYKLVQSVLMQENALQEAGGRIEDLENRVRELEDQLAPPQPQQRGSSGGFLGGLFGSKPEPQPVRRAASSVPQTGQRYDQPSGSPWGRQQAAPPPPQQGGYAPQGGYAQPQPPQGGGGGFMRSAMTTAAGVAGGMLAAGAIRDMMGGGAHAAGHADRGAAESHSPYEVTANDRSQADQNAIDDAEADAQADQEQDLGWSSDNSSDDNDV
jgi:hypothetical protein